MVNPTINLISETHHSCEKRGPTINLISSVLFSFRKTKSRSFEYVIEIYHFEFKKGKKKKKAMQVDYKYSR